MCASHGKPTVRFTLACDNETGHAVGNAGSSGQEGDAHDDIRDAQGVTDDRHLGSNTHNNTLSFNERCFFCCFVRFLKPKIEAVYELSSTCTFICGHYNISLLQQKVVSEKQKSQLLILPVFSKSTMLMAAWFLLTPWL